MSFKFTTYDACALRKCGASFVDAAERFERANKRLSTGQWTEFVLDWFAATAPSHVLVDAKAVQCARGIVPFKLSRVNRYGEFLVDLAHTSYPKYRADRPFDSDKYFDAALARPCTVHLALESEWGDADSGNATRIAVLQDALKVAAMRADVKVVVFGSHERTRSRIIDDLATLRHRASDPAPWLVADVPWRTKSGRTEAQWIVVT